jgi:hypothetical protein
MEIVITHTIHPDVMALLKSFVSPGFGGQQAKTEQIAASTAETVAAPRKRTAQAQPEASKIETAKETTASTPAATEKPIEFTDIRQLYLQKKEEGKQEKVKAILDEYGVEKLSAIKPEQFKEVHDKISAL